MDCSHLDNDRLLLVRALSTGIPLLRYIHAHRRPVFRCAARRDDDQRGHETKMIVDLVMFTRSRVFDVGSAGG